MPEVSKVILDGVTLMDVTQDTVNTSNTLTGFIGHKNDGASFTGSYTPMGMTITDVVEQDGGTVRTISGTEITGTKQITENGIHDVSSYAFANVNVIDESKVTIQDIWDRNISGDISITVSPAETESTRRDLGKIFQGSSITSLTLTGVFGFPDLFCGNATLLRSVYSDCTALGQRAFEGCTSLTTANFPEAYITYWAYSTRLDKAFYNCTSLTTVNIPKFPQIGNQMFQNCYLLEEIDLPVCTKILASGFASCRALTAVVLRSSNVVTLNNVNAFGSTPLRGYGGTYSGHVYVPNSLISSYQAATNWSSLYADYSDIFAPIEGSIYE